MGDIQAVTKEITLVKITCSASVVCRADMLTARNNVRVPGYSPKVGFTF